MTAVGSAKRPHIVAADVGGTKTALALAVAGPLPEIVAQAVVPSRAYDSLESLVGAFLAQPGPLPPGARAETACFAVAGPVVEDTCTLTNLGWRVSGRVLERALDIRAARLINDFSAAGKGIGRLGAADRATLQAGRPVEAGIRLVIGAGTGLGMGVITREGDRYVVHPSEAGHADFAPVDEVQDRLLAHLRGRFGRVSYERVVSGPGLANIFHFLQESGDGPQTNGRAAAGPDELPETIAERAVERRDPLAARALDIFVTAYGAFAGNMALAVLALGGVYLAGGIAPKILPSLTEGSFLKAFVDKGRFSDLLATVPVHVVTNPHVGLHGALLEANAMWLER